MKRDSECIFCKIAAGEIPCTKVLEDDVALGFMDIAPVAEAHVLLIPKPHYETVDELPPDLAAGTLKHLPDLVRAIRAATGCQGLNVLQNNGAVAGQLVPHVHFHLIPRDVGGKFHFNWPAEKSPQARMEQLADKIRQNL